MLYERMYMKSPRDILGRSFCDQLIFSLIVCFLLQSLSSLIFSSLHINQYFAFGLKNFRNGYVWTLLSYGFIHEGPLHLIVNLLGLHFIARSVEDFLGKKQFQLFCIIALLAGLVVWLPFNSMPNQYIVGFSSVVLASLSVFCLVRPNQPITLLVFFVLPLSVKPKWVLWATLGFELFGFLNSEIRETGVIAHSAHLGGMFCGLLFYFHNTGKFRLPVKFIFDRDNLDSSRKHVKSKYRVNFMSNDALRSETDRILDKINLHGFGSLTAEEKETLEKAKKLLEK